MNPPESMCGSPTVSLRQLNPGKHRVSRLRITTWPVWCDAKGTRALHAHTRAQAVYAALGMDGRHYQVCEDMFDELANAT